MPQNIRVAVIGESEYTPRLIRAILDRKIIDAQNLFLSAKNKVAKQTTGHDSVTWCKDNAAATVKSEIVLVCAPKREMSTTLSPIAKCTAGRIVVTVCDSPQIDLSYVEDRVANGTEIIIATLNPEQDGKLSANYTIGKNVRLYLHQPCRDLVNAMCG